MNNGIQGYNVQEEKPKDFKKMKTLIIAAVFVVIIILGIFWFKSFYKNNMVKYKEKVGESLKAYYISGDTKDLKAITDYFSEYEDNVKIKEDIQSYCYDEITKWQNYIAEKYVCDLQNLNSCELQLNEYNELLTKIERLYSFKEVQGYKIITNQGHTSIVEELNKKIAYNEDIVSNFNAVSQKNEDEIRVAKCAATNDCTNCRNGNACTCVYVENGVREEVICRNKADSAR
jgi:hypothetical protein